MRFTIEQMKALQRELVARGFFKLCSVLSDDPSKSGIHYAHKDGRKARISMGAIHYEEASGVARGERLKGV